jgi:hypothetical protein
MYGCNVTLNLMGEVRQHFKEKPGPTNKLIQQLHNIETEAMRTTPHHELLLCSTGDTDSPALASVSEYNTLLMKVNVYISHVSSGW